MGVNFYFVDDISLHEIFEGPAEVGEIDAIHRGAEALAIAEDDNFFIGVLLAEAVD